jgi:RNA polymerase sigma factor (sigma-70 family)
VRQALSGGSSHDVTALLEEVEPEFRALLRRFRVPDQDMEDLVQDVLVNYLVRIDEIQIPRSWLLTSLANRCLYYWRRRRRNLIHAVDEAVLEQIAGASDQDQEQLELRHDLSCALDQLSPRCRDILRLRYGYDCTSPEIAERTGFRPDHVRQITSRCLSALTRTLTEAPANG